MSSSHIWNFTIKIALTKTFSSVSNESSLVLVTYVLENKWWNIQKKTLPVHPKTAMGILKRKKNKTKQEKLLQRVLCYTQTQRETVTKLPKIYSSKTIHSLSVSEVIESMDN